MDACDKPQTGTSGRAESGYSYEYRHEYDSGTAHLDVHIAEAIANASGVDVTALQTPLWDVIDIDALQSLFENGQTGVVTFWYDQYRVRVEVVDEGIGHITVSTGAIAAK